MVALQGKIAALLQPPLQLTHNSFSSIPVPAVVEMARVQPGLSAPAALHTHDPPVLNLLAKATPNIHKVMAHNLKKVSSFSLSVPP
jgi:hypothetical protein